MTSIYDRNEFRSFHDRNSGKTYSDITLKHCRFVSCTISATLNPRKRSLLQNIQLYGCEVTGCTIYPAVIEEVLVSGLKTNSLLQIQGAVFKHVKLEGNIGEVMISPFVSPGWAKPHEQSAFDKVNEKYYQDVDWAIDISEGRFTDCELQRVPAKLVKRDPETQVVITREKALMGDWKKLDLAKTYWATSIQFFLDRGDADLILVAPKRYSKYQELLDGLKMLRDVGVAEPD